MCFCDLKSSSRLNTPILNHNKLILDHISNNSLKKVIYKEIDGRQELLKNNSSISNDNDEIASIFSSPSKCMSFDFFYLFFFSSVSLAIKDEILAAGGHDMLIMTYNVLNGFKPMKKFHGHSTTIW